MGEERRRGPRYQVTGLSGALHLAFSARLLRSWLEGVAIETTRPLRIGRAYALAGRRPAGDAFRVSGKVASCRLTAVRPAATGPAQSVYGSELVPDPEAPPGSNLAQILGERIEESLTVDAAYPAQVRVIGAYGALLESELELLVGSSCHVDLLLPGRPFTARASVVFVHARGDQEPAVYDLGVEFHNLAAEAREHLDAFLATLTA